MEHIPGKDNLLGDVPSRSFDQFPSDQEFLLHFSHSFPLPPQLGSWQLVHPPKEAISRAFSILRRSPAECPNLTVPTGPGGASLPNPKTNPLGWNSSKPQPSRKTESSSLWPLLNPSGKVSSTMESRLQGRWSRQRFVTAARSWNPRASVIQGN